MRVLSNYVAFTRIKTLAYIHIRPQINSIHVDTKLANTTGIAEPGFIEVGEDGWVRIILNTPSDVEKAKPVLLAKYEAS